MAKVALLFILPSKWRMKLRISKEMMLFDTSKTTSFVSNAIRLATIKQFAQNKGSVFFVSPSLMTNKNAHKKMSVFAVMGLGIFLPTASQKILFQDALNVKSTMMGNVIFC